MPTIIIVIAAVAGLVVGALVSYLIFMSGAKSKYKNIIAQAEAEGEVIKKNKLLEVKEKFMNKKAELEKEVANRNRTIQQAESRIKQREQQLQRQQEEGQRRKAEADALKESLDAQMAAVEHKKEELAAMQSQEREKLEAISGLSADEARDRLVESLKDEAKTAAAAYVNDIMDDARMTATKEAKRIIVQSIQRVATETAIENAVTVFHIENDDMKGRIIGREGRNIRALETATGVDLIIDDTPEAVIVSAFDPVRREIARVAVEKLIMDGRIHPARIEEAVNKARENMEATILQAGREAAYSAKQQHVEQEILSHLGRLKFRTSYSQNVLEHSLEVSRLMGELAAELHLHEAKSSVAQVHDGIALKAICVEIMRHTAPQRLRIAPQVTHRHRLKEVPEAPRIAQHVARPNAQSRCDNGRICEIASVAQAYYGLGP